ncbi:hypothetical protein P8452_47542 [Trifolium repens]|nr:hypothetical protein P8452_47542 [Trifolium repens]
MKENQQDRMVATHFAKENNETQIDQTLFYIETLNAYSILCPYRNLSFTAILNFLVSLAAIYGSITLIHWIRFLKKTYDLPKKLKLGGALCLTVWFVFPVFIGIFEIKLYFPMWLSCTTLGNINQRLGATGINVGHEYNTSLFAKEQLMPQQYKHDFLQMC